MIQIVAHTPLQVVVVLIGMIISVCVLVYLMVQLFKMNKEDYVYDEKKPKKKRSVYRRNRRLPQKKQ